MKNNVVDIFITEASELVSDLEKALLLLEKEKNNLEYISEVFRVMHSLKGTAGMFGYSSIGELTHNLETVYQNIRDGKNLLTHEILEITFLCLDHLKNILQTDHDLKNQDTQTTHQNILKKIDSLQEVASDQSEHILKSEENITKLFYVLFKPDSNLLLNGTNPLFLAEDLLDMGKGYSYPCFIELPAFENLDPSLSYIGFEFLIETNKHDQEIRDVFMFVEGQCELIIEKISERNEIKLEDLHREIGPLHKTDSFYGLEKIQQLIKKIWATQFINSNNKNAHKQPNNIRVSSDKIDDLMNLVSELVTTQASLSLNVENADSPVLSNIAEMIEKITRRLRDNAFSMSLISLDTTVIRFERLIRDLSKDLNKEIIFKTEGLETELDKSIIEKIMDPILHLVRNAIDHGIEMPEERLKKGKPTQGTLTFKSYNSGSNVIIEISDDGKGINRNKVIQKAISKGLIKADEDLSESEILNVLFIPGFSTADKITGISGRGVGLDVVKRNVSEIRGDIKIFSEEGKGTTFKLILPLTLSIIDGLLLKIGDTDFILPLTFVDKCYEIETHRLRSTFNDWIDIDNQKLPFLHLRRYFNIQEKEPTHSQIIKIHINSTSFGLAVDFIKGEHQAVLKPIGKLFKNQNDFSGFTILGDGSVALVLDPIKLLNQLYYK